MTTLINIYETKFDNGVQVADGYSEAIISDMPAMTGKEIDDLQELLGVDIMIF